MGDPVAQLVAAFPPAAEGICRIFKIHFALHQLWQVMLYAAAEWKFQSRFVLLARLPACCACSLNDSAEQDLDCGAQVDSEGSLVTLVEAPHCTNHQVVGEEPRLVAVVTEVQKLEGSLLFVC